VLLLDGFSLLYRAFFALPPMSTARGEPTSALYGFAALILKLLREEQPRGAAVALDGPEATFRHRSFAGYKASRPRAPTPLGRQLARLGELLDAFGFPAFYCAGFEADDVLASLARELREEGVPPLVVTGDLDALQCAVGSGRVHVVGRGVGKGKTYDHAAVWSRYGVSPAELPDWKALAGDPTDEIPGVAGVGAKSASALVRRFGGIPGLLGHLDEIEPDRLRNAIAARREDLVLWRDLARLRDDLALPAGPRWAPFGPAELARVRALFIELEFRSLLPRLEALPTLTPMLVS
jgi:DNA polymerase-1